MTADLNACHAPSRSVTRDECDVTDPLIAAAMWLAEQRGTLSRPIVEVQQRYGLNAMQACQACALAAKMRTCRDAFA